MTERYWPTRAYPIDVWPDRYWPGSEFATVVANIRADLNTIVSGIVNIGLVYDRIRWMADWTTFLNNFKTSVGGFDQIRGWVINYNGYNPEMAEFDQHIFRAHRFKIRGYMSLNDDKESEKLAANLAEDVCNALDDSNTLHGGTYHNVSLANIDYFTTVLFGSVLCHYIEVGIEITEFR